MKIVRSILKNWLPLAAVIVLLSGVIYTTVQQAFRMSANDPQIQMAEDAASALAQNQPADAVVPAAKVEISTSQAPYLMVFNPDGSLKTSNARLHGSSPDFPKSVFDSVRKQGQDRVSWQPEPGLRSATVIVPVNGGQGGFVLAGRSLRSTEDRIQNLGYQVLAGCLGTLAVTFILTILLEVFPFTRSG